MPDGSNLGSAFYTESSPSLLSRQPVAPPRMEERSPEWWQQVYPHLESEYVALKDWRYTWWWAWSDLAAYFRPDRYRFFVTANTMMRGRPLNDQIIDSTGLLAVNICAAGIWNGLVNPARPWMKLTVDPAFGVADSEGNEWLEHATQTLFTMFARSNFYSAAAQVAQDLVVFGSSPMVMYEDAIDGLRCYVPCAGEYYLASGARLSNDTLWREFQYTVAQIVGFFGWANCPSQIQQLWRQGGASRHQEFIVMHAIAPNTQFADTSRYDGRGFYAVPPRFAFRELYWLKGRKETIPLSRRGFNEQPFMVARWRVTGNDPYGRGPTWDCIGDNKQIQQMTLRQNEYGEKMVRPPMVAPPEMKNEPASIMPGMITYTNALNGKPLFAPAFELNGQGMQWIIAAIEKISQRVKEALFVPTFMAITAMAGVQPRNELELQKRDLEKLQVLGPMIDLFENEFAGPAVRRGLAIGERRGLIRPRPPALRRLPLKIEYESIIRMAMRANKTVSLKDYATTMGVATAAAKTADAPSPARVTNWDKWARRYAEAADLDADLNYTEDEVKQHDQIRLEEAQKQQQAQAVPEALKGAADLSKVMSQTPLNNGSALDALIGPGAFPAAGGG